MRTTIKVLVVDDSALIRQMLTRALSVDPRIEIVGTAKTGVEAIEKARDLDPDVITLDIQMPELDGLEALPHITKHSDARVVMLSSVDDPDTTYQALSTGAVDFIYKPRGGMASSLTELTELLLKKIRTAYRIDPSKVDGVRAAGIEQLQTQAGVAEAAPEVVSEPGDGLPPIAVEVHGGAPPSLIVAIAASTGGPPALECVFRGLVSSLPAAYLVVQHLPPGFTSSLARRLSSAGDVETVEAVDGMAVTAGRAYIAPHGLHMRVVKEDGQVRLSLTDDAPVHGVRPAADPLFESLAAQFGDRAVGVVLTGMGSDGARGLLAIRQAGGSTIVQNEETSVVWGMPGAAMKQGAARHVVPIGLVAAEIRRVSRDRSS